TACGRSLRRRPQRPTPVRPLRELWSARRPEPIIACRSQKPHYVHRDSRRRRSRINLVLDDKKKRLRQETPPTSAAHQADAQTLPTSAEHEAHGHAVQKNAPFPSSH